MTDSAVTTRHHLVDEAQSTGRTIQTDPVVYATDLIFYLYPDYSAVSDSFTVAAQTKSIKYICIYKIFSKQSDCLFCLR